MSTSRQTFLEKVRRAAEEGNRAGHAPPLPERAGVGYQGGGPDPAGRFCEQFIAAGGHAHRTRDHESAVATVLDLVHANKPQRVLVGRESLLTALALPDRLRTLGIDTWQVGEHSAQNAREPLFAADMAIAGVDYLVAETGSIVAVARPDNPRSLSLLPPVH